MASPVAPGIENVMGALLTIGAVLIVPVFGAESLSRRGKVTESIAIDNTAGDCESWTAA
jgi:hypothetical protein